MELSASQVKEILNFGRPAGMELGEEGGAGQVGYDLFAVLVHIGGTQGGHYIAFVRPEVLYVCMHVYMHVCVCVSYAVRSHVCVCVCLCV